MDKEKNLDNRLTDILAKAEIGKNVDQEFALLLLDLRVQFLNKLFAQKLEIAQNDKTSPLKSTI